MAKILVVDDERECADTMSFLFERLGHEAKVAYASEAALKLAPSLRPDIIFVDLSMRGIDVFSVARQIRDTAPALDRPYMVAVTDRDIPNLERLTKDAGFNAYLMKPVEFSMLLMMVQSLLQRQRNAPTGLV